MVCCNGDTISSFIHLFSSCSYSSPLSTAIVIFLSTTHPPHLFTCTLHHPSGSWSVVYLLLFYSQTSLHLPPSFSCSTIRLSTSPSVPDAGRWRRQGPAQPGGGRAQGSHQGQHLNISLSCHQRRGSVIIGATPSSLLAKANASAFSVIEEHVFRHFIL